MSQQASPLPSLPDAAVAQPCSPPGHGGNGRHGGAATSIAVGDRPNASGARPPPPPEAGKLRREQRADGPACVLAVGTANPANCIPQDEFADWYFRVTKSDHLTHLKDP
ncbi:hypothetical protein GQ55_8G190400 [Panicum hallii var. hallii]|uniref:Chalcone/stilbene synthase N-terminal domain-containing protein n=1 Tax=Panicum hallii var. hallii TaxID=1504633 RepID=A0A2T7CNZ0_9POAL|nr:hypothetical protein GQ55_8G190400 [Panicum hallii var. hallii]